MSRSNDPGHYFQTSDALATSERKAAKAKNQHGRPIKLPSKILAAHSVPSSLASGSESIYVAEAAGEIKRVDLDSGKISSVFAQAGAPLTCIDVDAGGNIATGCWNKTIYYIPAPGRGEVRRLQGHTDFVKCVRFGTLGEEHPILLSGGADATIIVWDLSPSKFGTVLHKLKGHTKALQDLAIEPTRSSGDSGALELFSASSDREIRRWQIRLEAASEQPDSVAEPIRAHETSVYRLRFDEDEDDEGCDLWSASADKTVKHLVRTRQWEADLTLEHPDFVRDVVVFARHGLVVTACRDEEVRVWEISSGALACTYSGHFEEVSALLASRDGSGVISVSIDGTIRRWGLTRADMARYREEVEREAAGEEETTGGEKEGERMLTAEEEAELAELLEDED